MKTTINSSKQKNARLLVETTFLFAVGRKGKKHSKDDRTSPGGSPPKKEDHSSEGTGNGGSKPFEWNTTESVGTFVKRDAVVLVNRQTNEILTFLNKKGDRLSSKLKSELDLIGE
ncbi:hypothetical protein C0638_04640 [Paenibacillus sp. lzh-N1]|nr:hypothetical protein [Paenibacillus sp. lzh-N1]AUO05905.1 hypothetical protein C0638_04640 [Paenibacillus sp. lzh-N1]